MIAPGVTEEMVVQFLECLDEGIHMVNQDGVTVFYNQAAARLDGMEVEEVLGNHLLEAFPSLTEKTSTLLKVLKTGEPISEKQQQFMNRKGKKVITVNRTIPLKDGEQVVGAVEISRDITRIKELSEQVIDLTERMQSPRKEQKKSNRLYRFEDIITQNDIMLREIERAKRASRTDSPVLVVGETGTGKELIVQSIHHHSPRCNGPFIAQNCAAIPSSLLEGILFGTSKGAFTGAEDRPGLFELADGGTLFLDEIHAMPIDLQAKLLRVLEDGTVRRVGGTQVKKVDVRILTATNEDPYLSMKEGRLRQDLYYRIHVIGIYLPPLRERKDDLPYLTRYFFRQIKSEISTPVEEISQEILSAFAQYDWPGNVRELKHLLEGALQVAQDKKLRLEHLPPHVLNRRHHTPHVITRSGNLREVLEQVEKEMIQQAMMITEGNIVKAAKQLGIPRQTLQYKLKKFKLK